MAKRPPHSAKYARERFTDPVGDNVKHLVPNSDLPALANRIRDDTMRREAIALVNRSAWPQLRNLIVLAQERGYADKIL